VDYHRNWRQPAICKPAGRRRRHSYMTTTQEILRAAAMIVDTNWSAKDDALDANGKPVECVTVSSVGGVSPTRVSAGRALSKSSLMHRSKLRVFG
jgi:hypothetical protein